MLEEENENVIRINGVILERRKMRITWTLESRSTIGASHSAFIFVSLQRRLALVAFREQPYNTILVSSPPKKVDWPGK